MVVSEIEKSLYKQIKLSTQQKKAMISASICGFITHLYFMCNMLFNDDTVSAYYGLVNPYAFPFAGASSGRWLMRIANYPTTWFRPPFFGGVIIILIMAILAAILVDIMKIKSDICSVLCGALLVVFPSVLAFMSLWDIGYALSVLLPVIAIYNVEKGNNVIISVLLCGLGLSIMPVNMMSVMVLNIYIVIVKVLSQEDLKFKNVWKPLVKQMLVILGGMAIVYLGIFIATHMNMVSSELATYQGGDEAITGKWIDNLIPNIGIAISKTRKFRISTMQMIPQLKFTFRICYAIQIVSVLVLLIKNKVYRKIEKLVVLILCLISLPIALSAISVVSSQFQYSWQHRMQWVFVLCGAFMLGERMIEALWEENGKRKAICHVIYYLISVNMCLMVFGFALTDNIVYRAKHYVVEMDTALCTRIAAVLDSDKEFSYADNPVYIMNLTEIAYADNSRSPLKVEPDLYYTITSDLDTNLWCYSEASIRAHLGLYEGVNIKAPEASVLKRIGEKWGDIEAEHADMKNGEFDVFRFEDTDTYIVVVKTAISSGIIDNR